MSDCYSAKLAIGYKFSCCEILSKEDSDDEISLLKTFCDLINCKYNILGSFWGFRYDSDHTFVIFSPKTQLKEIHPSEECETADFGPSFDLESVINLKPELEKLKKDLQSVGLSPGEPGVFLAYTVS